MNGRVNMLDKIRTVPKDEFARRATRAMVRGARGLISTTMIVLKELVRRGPIVDPSSEVVVVMASYGERLRSASIALGSIARGSVLPGRVVLVINENDVLDRRLEQWVSRGVEVWRGERFIGPHNKWYTFASNTPDFRGTMITADDDTVYPKRWLENLVAAASPDRVTAYRAHPIRFDRGGIAPYRTWMEQPFRPGDQPFITGVAGVAYPAKFVAQLASDGLAFMESCPRADDVWINRCIVRHGWSVRLVSGKPESFPLIWGSQTVSLQSTNVGLDANDPQIRDCFAMEDVAVLRERMDMARRALPPR